MLGFTFSKAQAKQDLSKARSRAELEIVLIKRGIQAYKLNRRIASGKYISNH